LGAGSGLAGQLGLFRKIRIRRRATLLGAAQFVERFVERTFEVDFVAGDFHERVVGFGIVVDNDGEARVGVEGGIAFFGPGKIERLLGEEAHFESSGPAHAPIGGDQVLEQSLFGGAGRLIFGFVGFAESIELVTVFVS
jgi:hypothetical protein